MDTNILKISQVDGVRRRILLALKTLGSLGNAFRYRDETMRQFYMMGVQALFLTIVATSFTSMVMAFEWGKKLEPFGAKLLLGRIISISVIREVGPMMTGLMIAARTGSREYNDLAKYKMGDLTAKINSSTLEYFFRTHQNLIQFIIEEASKIGFKQTKILRDPNSIRNLLVVFQRLGIKKVGELESLFEQARQNGRKIMKKIYEVVSNNGEINIENRFPILLLILITLRLKQIKFDSINTDEVVPKLLRSSIKSISLSIKKNKGEF